MFTQGEEESEGEGESSAQGRKWGGQDFLHDDRLSLDRAQESLAQGINICCILYHTVVLCRVEDQVQRQAFTLPN